MGLKKLVAWFLSLFGRRQRKLARDRERRIRHRLFHWNGHDRSRRFGYFGNRK